ncbi:MAG: TonB-dependent receptor [Chitinophagaceae bacterium]|nr:TonB-dependent receptor [Chitinophagaceae bacterium]
MRRLLLLCAFLLPVLAVSAQGRTITGKITDENGSPIAGATVGVKGSRTAVSTNADGMYSITVDAKAKVLIVSYVGKTSDEITIGVNTVINTALRQEESTMQEVVVVGYGTQRKRDLTGNVSKISGDATRNIPVQSFDQALSGRAAGVSVMIPNGVLNNPPVIRVRGISSINLSSFPLVVIDGVPTFVGNVGTASNPTSTGVTAPNNILSDINPSDIESFEILKDAAASAIYGSRASAGVLIITTKKGRQGKAKVNYDGWVGSTKAMNLLDVLSAEEYVMLKNEGLTNVGTPPNGTTRGFYLQTGPDGKPVDTDWYDYIYQNGLSHSHTLNISGANEKTSYYFSFGYTDQEGMLKKNTFKRLGGRMNLDHKVTERITVGGNFTYSNSINSAPNSGSLPGQAFNTSGLGRLPLVLAPNVTPFNPDGSYNINIAGNTIGQGANITALNFTNPVMILDLNKFSSESDRVLANVYADVKLLQGLNFRTVFGIDYLNTLNKEFQNPIHGDGTNTLGAAANMQQRFKRQNWQNLLTFDRKIGASHSVNLLLGNEQQFTHNEGWGAQRRQVGDSYFDEYQGGFVLIVPSFTSFPTSNFLGESYLVSFFGRLNYDYKKKYFLSLNARRDGYSAFAPGKKYGNFGGASAGWAVSQEEFFKNSGLANVFSNLKLRGSYGQVGNINGIADYASYFLFTSGLYGSQAALFYSQAGNTDLTWETSKKTDIGFEAGFFNNRITLDFAYYKNDIDGLILNDPQSPSKGVAFTNTLPTSLATLAGGTVPVNIGRMVNKGIEITINAKVINKKDFTWSSNFNIGTLHNEVKELATGNADIFIATSGLERPSIIRVGESIGSFYAVRTNGVNPANGRRIFVYRNGQQVQFDLSSPVATRWTYLDGTTAPRAVDQAADGVLIGPALPTWTGGWENTVRYKNFDFSMLLYFSGGNYVYNGTKAGLRDNRNWNNSVETLTRWQKPGDVTNIPRLVFGDNLSNGSGIVISENVEKGDFLKARNISIGYSVPLSVTQKAKISSFRVYAAIQNAFVITNYTGFDPEVSANGNNNSTPSVDRNSVPQARTITFGVNVGF